MSHKLTGAARAVGYWGRSPYKRIVEEQTAEKIRVMLQDKLIARGTQVWLYIPVTSGIRCTCRKETNKANDRPCPECYGTGFVPGFTRFLHETVFFTASQIDSDSFTVLPQDLSVPPWVASTTVPNPTLTGGTVVASTLGAPPWAPSTSVPSPRLTLSTGALSAPPWSPSTAVLGAALTTAGGSLNNVELDRTFKPNYLRLSEGALTGSLTTGLIAYSNPNSEPWTYDVAAYVRESGTSYTVEYSFDRGSSWYPIADIAGANPPPAPSGFLSFRVTLTRSTATQRSPAFSAVRARHVQSEHYNDELLDWRAGSLEPGQILVLRPWIVEQARSLPGQGVTLDWLGDRSWTMPLDFFDTRVERDTPPARIPDRAPGPHPFYEHATGIKTGDRVALSTMKWNEEFGLFTHQSFDERRIQDDEPPYADVF